MIYLYRLLYHQLNRFDAGRRLTGYILAHKRQFDTVESFAIAILLAVFIVSFITEAFKIPTGSMNDTLLEGDRIFVNKFMYPLGMLQLDRGDVVVFQTHNIAQIQESNRQSGQKTPYYIKRLVALPGDTVRIEHGRLHINGEALNEPEIFANNTYLAHEWAPAVGELWPFGNANQWPDNLRVAPSGPRPQALVDTNGSIIGVFEFDRITLRELKLPRTMREWLASSLRRGHTLQEDMPVRVVHPERTDQVLYRMEWRLHRIDQGPPQPILTRITNGEGDTVAEVTYRLQLQGRHYIITPEVRNADGVRLYRRARPIAGSSDGNYINDYVVPPGQVMLMGDNSLSSQDSRYWGPVPIKDIVGRAFFRFWPLHRIGFIRDDPTPEGRHFHKDLQHLDEPRIPQLPRERWPSGTSQPAPGERETVEEAANMG